MSSNILSIDSNGEFPSTGSRTGKWSSVHAEVDKLQVNVSHVRVLVTEMKTAKSLITSCFSASRRKGYRIETITETTKEGVYVYIRKIVKETE